MSTEAMDLWLLSGTIFPKTLKTALFKTGSYHVKRLFETHVLIGMHFMLQCVFYKTILLFVYLILVSS